MLRQLIFFVFASVFAFTLLAFQQPCRARGPAESEVSRIMKKARKDVEKMTLPVNKYNEQGLKAAKETADLFHSPEFQERIQCEQQRLEKEVFVDFTKPWKKKTRQRAAEQKEQAGSLAAGEKVFLFISSSVPDETVHSYIAALDRAGDPHLSMVMRGFVGGVARARARKDQSYFGRILKKQLDCPRTQTPCERYQVSIRLKPSLFTRYGITKVPAVIYQHDKDSFLIQGDAGLDYLLEKINREAKSTGLTKLIKKIRGTL